MNAPKGISEVKCMFHLRTVQCRDTQPVWMEMLQYSCSRYFQFSCSHVSGIQLFYDLMFNSHLTSAILAASQEYPQITPEVPLHYIESSFPLKLAEPFYDRPAWRHFFKESSFSILNDTNIHDDISYFFIIGFWKDQIWRVDFLLFLKKNLMFIKYILCHFLK